MKKTYVSPLTNEVNVATDNVMSTTSFNMNDDEKISTGGQLGKNHRGEWGNLWSK